MAERDLLGGRRSRVAEIIDDVRSEASEEEIASKPQTPATVDKKGKGKAAADEEEELLRVESEDSNEEDEDEEIGEDEFVLAPLQHGDKRHWLTMGVQICRRGYHGSCYR